MFADPVLTVNRYLGLPDQGVQRGGRRGRALRLRESGRCTGCALPVVIESFAMDLTAPINARQVEVLKWIADGCPEGVMKDSTFKTTAIALQGRRLVTVSRKGGVWRAATTEAGDHYLRYGTYPDDMRAARQGLAAAVLPAKAPHVGGRRAAVSRKPAAIRAVRPTRGQTIEQQAEDLVARDIQAGGVLEIDTEKDEADYQRL
jgi:hypothetical protein